MESFTVIPVASPLHDPHAVREVVAPYVAAIEQLGGDLGDDRALDGPDPVVVLVLTGGTESRVLDTWRRRHQVAPGDPLLVIAHPGQNSLPAALESVARLHQDGGRGRICYLTGPDDRDGLETLAGLIDDVAVHRRLAASRIGLIGDPSDWLVASSPEAALVARSWGPTVVHVPIADLLHRVRGTAAAAGARLAVRVANGASASREPDDVNVADAARVEPALAGIVEAEGLDAIAVRCFDLVTDAHTSGCLALAELNDRGIVAGCEGDLPSTIALMWTRELLGTHGWMANPARVDRAQGTVLLAHCTVPRSMVSSYELRSHFESGLGVALSGHLPPGPVTLVRIGGRDLDRLWVAEGEALPTTTLEGLCRTQVEVRIGAGAVGDLLERPLGNHLVLVPGHHRDRLVTWWRWLVAAPDAQPRP